MIVRRLAATAALLGLAATLGACSPFAGFMADHWPHWAGGLPADAPPRPGAPGYEEFIAHGEPAQNPPAPASSDAPGAATSPTGAPGTVPSGTAAAASAPQFQARKGQVQVGRAPVPPAQTSAPRQSQAAAPAGQPSAEDQSVVKGGLY